MFESFYGLTANPFRMSADEHFRYAHRTYIKAWSYLKYALEQAEGFVLITGRPGTGKTTLVREILAELDRDRVEPVNLVTNRLQGEELLRLVALEFGYPAQEYNKATLLTRIEQHALELNRQGRRVVVIVDEAQNLSSHGLEELRLLSNLQAGNQPLFQIVLIGQEELRSLIYGQGIENIQQRIVTSCRLEPMPAGQVQGYVEHRLAIVGWEGDPSFEAAIYPLIHRITHGVPREINLVVARLLLYGSLEQKHGFTKADLFVVLNELEQERRLAFDQTAILAELSTDAQDAEAPQECEAESALPDRSDSLPPVAETPESPAGEMEEPLVLAEERETALDALPSVPVAPDEDSREPQGLLSDVDELLAGDDRFKPGRSGVWRWVFYPLAIVLLLMAIMVPKPIELADLWGTPPPQTMALNEKVPEASGDPGGDTSINTGIEQPPPAETGTAVPPQAPDTLPREATQTAVAAPSPDARQEQGQTSTDSMTASQREGETAGEAAALVERSGAAADTPPQHNKGSVIESETTYFLDFEQPNDTLDDRSELRLADLTALLHTNPGMKIVITGILEAGHEPLEHMREALQRAEQIAARLISAGISPRRIFVEGGSQKETPVGASVMVRAMP